MTGVPEDELPEGWDALSRADSEADGPPPGAKERVRTHLVATLGLAATAGTGAAAAGTGAAAGSAPAPGLAGAAAKLLLVKKAAVLGVVAATAVTGGTVAYVEVRARRQDAELHSLEQRLARPPPPAPAAVVPEAVPGPDTLLAPGVGALGDERALLDQARLAILQGRLEDAHALLEQHASTFPDGMLGEEGEALQIRLLVRQDRRAEAARRAAQFRQAHPRSIQLPVIDQALRGP